MTTKSLVAGVQYGDWKGTSAADESDSNRATDYLASKGHPTSPGDLVAIEMWAGENHGQHKDPVSVTFVIADAERELDVGGIAHYREVRLQMPVAEFLGLFKRFSVVLKTRNRSVSNEYVAVPDDL